MSPVYNHALFASYEKGPEPQTHAHKQRNKKLSCRRETARCFVSLNISLSHSNSLKIIRNDTYEWALKLCMYLVPFQRILSVK